MCRTARSADSYPLVLGVAVFLELEGSAPVAVGADVRHRQKCRFIHIGARGRCLSRARGLRTRRFRQRQRGVGAWCRQECFAYLVWPAMCTN